MKLEAYELKCPYINKEKARTHGTMYYCDYEDMEFESMSAHCAGCEMYQNIIKLAMRKIIGK